MSRDTGFIQMAEWAARTGEERNTDKVTSVGSYTARLVRCPQGRDATFLHARLEELQHRLPLGDLGV